MTFLERSKDKHKRMKTSDDNAKLRSQQQQQQKKKKNAKISPIIGIRMELFR